MVSRISLLIRKTIIYVIAVLILIIVLFPIYWLISSSFKTRIEITSIPPTFLFYPTLSNMVEILTREAYIRGLMNSLVVCSCSLVMGIILGVPAAYAIARFDFGHKRDLMFWFLSMRFLPPVAIIIPLYYIWVRLGLYDTYVALIITYSVISLPLTILLMVQYFKAVPIEIEEASQVDGCSRLQTFYKIALPNVLPTLISTGSLIFILLWNEFFIAFALTQHNLTLPVTVAAFATISWEIPWGQVCAAASFLMIPPLVLTAIFRKALISLFLPTEQVKGR